MQYFLTPTHCIAVNPGAGTHSLCKAIVQDFYPERTELHLELEDAEYRSLVEQADTPELPVLVLLREPLERFASKVGMMSLDVDATIKELQEGGELADEPHFAPQSRFVTGKARVFLFPSELKAFCKVAGLKFPLPKVNETTDKPALSDEQRQALEKFYQDDIKLINSHD